MSGIGTDWTQVTAFLVNFNRLNGTFPFLENPLLGTIFLNENDIGGDLNAITSLKSLSWLEALENKFSGTLSEEITTLEYLRILTLTNNSLSGAIPNNWTNSSLLESFLVSGNKLTGSLPDTIASSPKLRKLQLANNLLSGSIPSSYYQMQSLQELYIDGNTLGGSLSQLNEPLYFSVQEFAINNNSFVGRFPVEQFENTEILNVLALQDNALTGTITETICKRLNVSNPNARLKELSVDCDLIECTCCTCY
ncbi:hypothetical protein HJC23_004370 [Cyclotella cryptica]|uniref:L domain-like protein n=1 Tax=Cyclotella cryptica TaxID=29204 RepID=A0ABD3PGV5_9STRA